MASHKITGAERQSGARRTTPRLDSLRNSNSRRGSECYIAAERETGRANEIATPTATRTRAESLRTFRGIPYEGQQYLQPCLSPEEPELFPRAAEKAAYPLAQPPPAASCTLGKADREADGGHREGRRERLGEATAKANESRIKSSKAAERATRWRLKP